MSTPHRLQQKPFIVPPCEVTLDILFQDEHIVIVNKPAGLLSVPGKEPENNDSVYTRLLEKHPDLRVVHRLDLSTSGIMLLALNAEIAGQLGKQFQQRIPKKEYLAVVNGIIEQDSGEINLPLIVDWENRPVQKVCHDTGKPSLTYFQVLERDKNTNHSRVLLKPHTGRTHQLRVHMQAIGHSIMGCEFYAPDDVCLAEPRLLLHAQRLTFNHPVSGEEMDIHCPADF